jgi:deoxycytidine triphosphate deaminase
MAENLIKKKLSNDVRKKLMDWLLEEGVNVKLKKDETPGVLVSSEIIDLCSKDPPLIGGLPDDPDELKRRIKPAAIHLSLGEEYRVGERSFFLDEKKPYLTIQPYQVVIVQTQEELNMPKNLIARWNLRISLVYKGLLWVGGPQVDPGYKGFLFCPLYNLSTNPVTLQYGEPFATIDFVKLASGKSIAYKRQQKRFKMSHYSSFKSAPEAAIREVKEARRRMEIFEATSLTAMGIIIAALAILATSTPEISKQGWPSVLWIIVAAIVTFISGLIIGIFVGKST